MRDLTQLKLEQLVDEVQMDIIIGGRQTSILERQARYPKVWAYVLQEADKLAPGRANDKIQETMWLAVLCGAATAMEAMEYANGDKGAVTGAASNVVTKPRTLLDRLLFRGLKGR